MGSGKGEVFAGILCVLLRFSSGQDVEVDLDLGNVVGLTNQTVDANLTYYAFKGIKYAEVPTRFEPSVPVKPWNGTYDARQDKPVCIQLITVPIVGTPESEDCLHLSVYTPQLPTNTTNPNLPVMVWIYGGFFVFGDSLYNTYGPDYLLDEQVVVVTLNYRLSVFGFLSTGDSKIPGNNALKDIVIALQFVQDNIAKFGGNPEGVTIFGESAGAALISYLLQSPLTLGKGLFKGAIMQSGNTLSPAMLQRNPAEMFDAFLVATGCKLAQLAGTDAAIRCLRRKPLEVLKIGAIAVFTIKSLQMLNVIDGVPFTTVIEPPSPQAAVVDNPYQFMLNGSAPDVPFIMGINSEEGLALEPFMVVLKPFTLQIDLNHSLLIPDDMNVSPRIGTNQIAPRILDFYFQNQSVFLAPNIDFERYISNNVFDRPTRKYFELVQDRVPGYFYVFSYSAQNNSLGVPHGDDIGYLWRTSANQQFSPQSSLVRSRMVRLWTNFAKTGNPTPDANDELLQNVIWPTAWVNATAVQYLDIGANLRNLENPKEEMYEFWEGLYDQFATPITTY